MPLISRNRDSQKVEEKSTKTLTELAQGAGGGLAIDIQDANIDATIDQGGVEDRLDDIKANTDGLEGKLDTLHTDVITLEGLQSILDQYQLSNVDETGGATKYYGYENPDGRACVIKQVDSAGISTFTFAASASNYATTWTNRASLTYASLATTF